VSAATFLSTYRSRLPWWLHGPVAESLATTMDRYVARVKLGLYARFPTWAASSLLFSDEAALAAIGRDRKIVRGIGEPAAAYAERLIRAIDDHRTRGNPFAMLRQLRAYLQAPCVVRTVDRRGNWFSIDADGNETTNIDTGNWDWDGRAASPEWARFWVIIYPVGGTVPWARSPQWGSPTLFGDGDFTNTTYTIGTTATRDEVAAVKSIIRNWKPAGTTCEQVIIAFDEATFTPAGATDPNGEWGTWGNHTGSPVRLSSARYWGGVRS
jgi:hypothetical protein